MEFSVEIVDITKVTSMRPGYDLVEFEDGTDPLDGFVLLGFDEIGQWCREPKYAFIAPLTEEVA